MARTWIVIDCAAPAPAKGWRGYADDEVVEEDQALRNAMAAGLVAAIPVERELLAYAPAAPAAGYWKRAWGRGLRLDGAKQVRACPGLLYVHPACAFVHWRALVVPTSGVVSGSLRLVSMSTPGTFEGGLAATSESVVLEQLTQPVGPLGGWVVGGVARIQCATEGYLALGLLARAAGAAVQWTAYSQAARSD